MNPSNYDPFAPRQWKLAHGRSIELGPVSRIMGILNVTPDSFSDGGNFINLAHAIDHSAKMIGQGADIIDIGGQSTKPGARQIDQLGEQERVLPVIDALVHRFDVVISVDTYRVQTAKYALEAGAHLINDVCGFLHDENMAAIVAQFGAGICLMHNSRGRDISEDIMGDQIDYLSRSLAIARNYDIDGSRIILDPGFGFGKNAIENLAIMAQFERLNLLEYPLLCGTSRKRFTGSILGKEDTAGNRDIVTAATSVVARMAGCAIFRVHQVDINHTALKLADALIETNRLSR